METKAKTYGQAIKRLLDDLGWSARKLAQEAGVTGASLSLILSDDRNPSVETVERLLRAAGKSWAWLDENMQPLSDAQRRKADDPSTTDPKGKPARPTADAKPKRAKGKKKRGDKT